MITKYAASLLRHAVNDAMSPLNAGLSAYTVGAGMQSVGGALGMTVGGTLGSRAYDRLNSKFITPGINAISKKIPGKFGKILTGVSGLANSAMPFVAPTITGAVGAELGEKYAPIYKRPTAF